MKDRIIDIIRGYMSKTFGNPDALPGPVVEGLAEEIDNHGHEIYESIRDEYDYDDIDMVAGFEEVELTEDERKEAFSRYRKAKEYESSIDSLSEIINDIADKREKEKSQSSLSSTDNK